MLRTSSAPATLTAMRKSLFASSSSLAAAAAVEPKQVTFGPVTERIVVERIAPEHKKDVFYTKSELRERSLQEIKELKKAQKELEQRMTNNKNKRDNNNNNSNVENETVTLRGIEDFLIDGDETRKAKVQHHTKTVLREWRRQDLFGPTATGECVDYEERWNQLRQFSKNLSKEDRAAALKVAQSDAHEAWGRRHAGSRRGVLRTFSNPLKMMRASAKPDVQRVLLNPAC